MPTYEYICNQCGEEFEKRVSFAEANSKPVCPKCASPDTSKKLSRTLPFGGGSGSGSSSSSGCGSHGGFS